VGSRSERETTRTEIHISRTTDTQKQEGGAVQQQPSGPSGAPAGSPQTDHSADPGTPYVGGNYVSGRSTIRYVLEDNHGEIKMYGYDVRSGRRVFVGLGKMDGKRLIIPNYYSFLDETYGTLKLDLAEDGKTFEGYFEGMDVAEEGRVILMRLP
jgi:hypothetical protein